VSSFNLVAQLVNSCKLSRCKIMEANVVKTSALIHSDSETSYLTLHPNISSPQMQNVIAA